MIAEPFSLMSFYLSAQNKYYSCCFGKQPLCCPCSKSWRSTFVKQLSSHFQTRASLPILLKSRWTRLKGAAVQLAFYLAIRVALGNGSVHLTAFSNIWNDVAEASDTKDHRDFLIQVSHTVLCSDSHSRQHVRLNSHEALFFVSVVLNQKGAKGHS